MERLCFLIYLVPGAEEDFDRRQREIWPEMTDAMSTSGYTNYTLFRRGTTVVGCAECVPAVKDAAELMGTQEVAKLWNESFEGVIETMTDADGNLFKVDEVWHLA